MADVAHASGYKVADQQGQPSQAGTVHAPHFHLGQVTMSRVGTKRTAKLHCVPNSRTAVQPYSSIQHNAPLSVVKGGGPAGHDWGVKSRIPWSRAIPIPKQRTLSSAAHPIYNHLFSFSSVWLHEISDNRSKNKDAHRHSSPARVAVRFASAVRPTSVQHLAVHCTHMHAYIVRSTVTACPSNPNHET